MRLTTIKIVDLPVEHRQELIAKGRVVGGGRWLEIPSRYLIFGAGDVVAMIAQPIARAIDRVAGTRLADCGGCKKRQAKLNELIPL